MLELGAAGMLQVMGPPSAMSEAPSTAGSGGSSEWAREYEDEDTWSVLRATGTRRHYFIAAFSSQTEMKKCEGIQLLYKLMTPSREVGVLMFLSSCARRPLFHTVGHCLLAERADSFPGTSSRRRISRAPTRTCCRAETRGCRCAWPNTRAAPAAPRSHRTDTGPNEECARALTCAVWTK